MIGERAKVRARGMVTRAIKTGRLLRPAVCARCHTECKPQAHHPDYTLPLDVEWLCFKCHQQENAKAQVQNRTPRLQRWYATSRPYMTKAEQQRVTPIGD